MIGQMEVVFLYFAVETGILGEVQQYQRFGPMLIGALAVLCCFLGVKVCRVIFSAMIFVVVTLLCCFGMADRAQWGTIVTTFTVTGCTLAFLGYQWKSLGAVIVCAAMSVSMVYAAVPGCGRLLLLCAAVFAGAAVYHCPLPVSAFVTALWGASVIVDVVRAGGSSLGLAALLFMAGFPAQVLIGKKTKAFDREYSPGLQKYLDDRKRKRVC